MKRNLGFVTAVIAIAMVFVGCKPEVEHVHTFAEWKTVVEPTDYEDGSKERTCSTCKYVDKEIIPALGHHHNIKSEWSSDETSHWHAYDCGRPEHFEDKAAHNFIYKDNGWQKCEICDKESSTPVSLDTLGTYDSAKMTFGVYPQTIKADSVTVDKTVTNTEITGADYYLGSDGAWYAECTENAYGTGEQYKYSNGNTVSKKSDNSVKYFKVEPIEWVYLGSTKCLHAKKILTANIQWHASSNNYQYSNIRSWLNGTFYDSAFTENQKKKIKTTTVDNSVASTGNSSNRYICENTNDKVYLLSYKEATTTGNGFKAYNFIDASRIRFPTDYALANYCEMKSNSSYGGWWWLRSPYDDFPSNVREVTDVGKANGLSTVSFRDFGVVPALSISE